MNKKSNIELGFRIRDARIEANLTQAMLHDLTGISITQLSNYENGSRNIGIENLSLIAEATNKTIDEIYFGSSAVKPLTSAKNEGELIVNCINALYEKGVIGILPHETTNEFIYDQISYTYRLAFLDNAYTIEDLVKKLIDFNENIDNYKEPEKFKKQILDAYASQLNKERKRK